MPYTYRFPRPAVTVDIILITQESPRKVLLIQRGHPPFEGDWAIPGGFVDEGETLEQAAHRELQEETHLENIKLQQLAAFGDPGRDPRGWTVSIVFWGGYEGDLNLAHAGDDAANAQWWPLNALPPLAFDHADILQKIIQQINKNQK